MSVVDAACVVNRNVGHLFVMLLCIWPQVEVNEGRVDVAHLSFPLSHQLHQFLLNQLYRVNGTTTDLHFSSIARVQQLTCETTMQTCTCSQSDPSKGPSSVCM